MILKADMGDTTDSRLSKLQKRRTVLKTAGTLAVAGLAGCVGDGDDTPTATTTTENGTTDTTTDTATPTETPTETATDTPTDTPTPQPQLPDDPEQLLSLGTEAESTFPGETITVSGTIENVYLFDVNDVAVSLAASGDGVEITSTTPTEFDTIPEGGGSESVEWEVTLPDAEGEYSLTADLSYSVGEDTANLSVQQSITAFSRFDGRDGLVARYSFGSPYAEGSTVSNRTGSGYNGEVVGGVELGIDAPTDSAGAGLNGSDGTVVIDDADGLDPAAYTVSLWTRVPADASDGAGAYSSFFGKSESMWTGVGADGQFPRFDPYDLAAGGDTPFFISETSIVDGEWHHLAFVHSPPDGRSAIYIDGELAVADEQNVVESPSSENPLALGSKSNAADHLNGDLADVRFYNRPLEESEITTLFENVAGSGGGGSGDGSGGDGSGDIPGTDDSGGY